MTSDLPNLTLAMMNGLGNLAILYVIVVFIIHVMMAIAVYNDAEKLESKEVKLFLFRAILWGAIVFIFGLAGLAVYWAMHYSSLRDSREPGSMNQDDEDTE